MSRSSDSGLDRSSSSSSSSLSGSSTGGGVAAFLLRRPRVELELAFAGALPLPFAAVVAALVCERVRLRGGSGSTTSSSSLTDTATGFLCGRVRNKNLTKGNENISPTHLSGALALRHALVLVVPVRSLPRMAPLSLCRRRASVEDDLAKPAPLSLDRDVVGGQLRLLQEQQILWSR